MAGAALVLNLAVRCIELATRSNNIPSHQLITLLTRTDSESVLARGEKLNLSEISVADLILIPGVSDRLAKGLIENRDSIVDCICDENPIKPKKSQVDQPRSETCFEKVGGIGKKIAETLNNYLQIGDCAATP